MDDSRPVRAPMIGTVVDVLVTSGDAVRAGQPVVVLESMKMEHLVEAEASGVVTAVAVGSGDTVEIDQPLVWMADADVVEAEVEAVVELDLDAIRPDLAEVVDRQRRTLDEARPEAVERRRRTHQRTARENIADLCDPGTFVEYGSLVVAAQRRRRTLEDLIARTPTDGMVTGIGHVNGALFPSERSRCAVLSYDYTVLAGTQGHFNHVKKDRMFTVAEQQRLPMVVFAEGGGGRPGDTDAPGVAGLDVMAFHLFGRLSGLVPLVGIVSGRCFAGNAARLGSGDVVIATRNANIGMGGPAMIEGGGLGVFRPEEVGPTDVQAPNGVIDVLVDDEAEAVAVAKRYLAYFQGPLARWECADQRLLRRLVPENRLRAYDVRAVIDTLADTGSVLELRRHFGRGMVTALVRVEGRPLGLIANNPMHLGGALDSDGADKAARFLQLCDAFGLPVISLVDTPGYMVGRDAEATGLVRHASRLLVAGAALRVPLVAVILRRGYGLGAQAMVGGSLHEPLLTVAWPSAHLGPMGLEGAVRLAMRKELEAIDDADERERRVRELTQAAQDNAKALNAATLFEIDDVIDPADTRALIASTLAAATAHNDPPPPGRFVDTW
jgi:acetyl-CoA carboxylase carboxyltransferase component